MSEKINLDIFKYASTYQNDFQKPQNAAPVLRKTLVCQKHLSQTPKIKQKEFHYQDNESFVRWKKGVHVPSFLHYQPNDITQSDPYKPFEIPRIPEDPKKAEVLKTRPRVYMSPAVSMDDVDDLEVRRLLCNNMYTSEMKKCSEEVVKTKEREIKNTTVEAQANPVQLKIDLLPPLPHNFRNKGMKFEEGQRRVTVDPTRTFWIHKDPPVKCGACVNPVEGLVPEEMKQEIKELIGRDKLRLAHDYPIPGYTGYRPRLSAGVSLAKAELTVTHPFLSVTQAITTRYAEDKMK